jgi:hypothetical protein
LGTVTPAGLAAGFGAGFGGSGTVTVFVNFCVVDDAGDEVEAPTQTVTDPAPSFEP